MNKQKFKKIICKQCKNEISPYYNFKEYAYKVDSKIFCSYGCMQKYKQEHKHRNCNYVISH